MSYMLQGARVRVGESLEREFSFPVFDSPEEAVQRFVDFFLLDGVASVHLDAGGPGRLNAEYLGDRNGFPWAIEPLPGQGFPCVAEAVVVRLEPVWLRPPASVDHHPV
jgi:hypothetical protein